MADKELVNLFKSVNGQLSNLTTTMGTQSVNRYVKIFDGSRPNEFKEWVKSVEKFCNLTGVPRERIKLIAHQTSAGPVSNFLTRYLEGNVDISWNVVKGALRFQFGDVIDSQYSLSLLSKIKQRSEETVQIYAERFLNIAEDAFQTNVQNAEIQKQLVGYFIDGLRDDSLKLKVMRENSQTFEAAMLVAAREQNLKKRFQLRTGHKYNDCVANSQVPKKVTQSRNKLRCGYCKQKGHLLSNCRIRQRKARAKVSILKKITKKQNNYACFACGNIGHFARKCPNGHQINKNKHLNGSASHM